MGVWNSNRLIEVFLGFGAKDVTVEYFSTTYYWRVDEVNAVPYPGGVWSFTTEPYAVVEDFESYDDFDNRIYDTWIDGLTDGKSNPSTGIRGADAYEDHSAVTAPVLHFEMQ